MQLIFRLNYLIIFLSDIIRGGYHLIIFLLIEL